MASLVSPGVNVTEIDLSGYIPNVSTSFGALVGNFNWGPLNEVQSLDNEGDLVSRFHKPSNTAFIPFLCASSFLAYAGGLRVVRVADEANAKNAVVSGTAIIIKNEDDYEQNYMGGAANVGIWAAKYPGVLGNSLKVSFCPSAKAFRQTLTGTSAATGTALAGTSTAYTTELAVGSRVYNPAGTEYRTVVTVTDADSVVLDSAFSADFAAAAVVAEWEYHDEFNVAPGTSDYAAARAGANDECHMIVIDEDGAITGTPNAILEKFAFVSKASDAKNADGTSNFYKDVVNYRSRYLWWMDKLTTGTNWETAAAGTTYTEVKKAETNSLIGGVDAHGTLDAADLQRGWDLFVNKDDWDISLCIMGDAGVTTVNWVIDNVAEVRKDCVVFCSPLSADVLNNVGQETADILVTRNNYRSSTYGTMDSNWKKIYDRYNDAYRWIPVNADSAGLCARTDFTNDAWWAATGYNRGRIKNAVALAWNPGQAARDDLYPNGVNPVISQKGQGIIHFGNRVMISKPSAFDRLNVRRLFIVLEKAISNATKYLLFEFNDLQTRLLFKNIVEPYLRGVQSRRGIYNFYVVCDETNNTGEVIDRNEFVGDIYIQPAKAIDFIQLNFIATKTGASFQEIINTRS